MITTSLYQLLVCHEEKKKLGHKIVALEDATSLYKPHKARTDTVWKPPTTLVGWKDLNTCESMQMSMTDLLSVLGEDASPSLLVNEERKLILEHLAKKRDSQDVSIEWLNLRRLLMTAQGRSNFFGYFGGKSDSEIPELNEKE